MTSNNNFMGMDPFKLFEQFKSNHLYESFISTCQKNMTILSEAQKTMIDAASSLGKMQTSFACYAIQEAGNHMNKMANASSVEEKMNLHKEAVKKGVDETMDHGRKVAEEWSKSQKNLASQMSETIDTMRKSKDHMRTSANKH